MNLLVREGVPLRHNPRGSALYQLSSPYLVEPGHCTDFLTRADHKPQLTQGRRHCQRKVLRFLRILNQRIQYPVIQGEKTQVRRFHEDGEQDQEHAKFVGILVKSFDISGYAIWIQSIQ